ncbi:MAG: hypothetical protein AABW46_03055 [Nanoarchaeota archaeon]
MEKKGDIWIATVIYIAIGVVTLTLIVSTGVPLINKLRDRNTFVQSKDVMHSIDDAINEVVSEGPGSRRALNPVSIKKGELTIRDDNSIFWQMDTKAKVQETYRTKQEAVSVIEKNLEIVEYEHEILVDNYVVQIILDYSGKNIEISSEGEARKLTGKFGLIISNEGIVEDTGGSGVRPTRVNIEVI